MNLLMIYQSIRLMKRNGLIFFNHTSFLHGIRFHRFLAMEIMFLIVFLIFFVLSHQSQSASIE